MKEETVFFKTNEEKTQYLFDKQKRLLDTFLNRGAITKSQYDKSLGDLIIKMGVNDK